MSKRKNWVKPELKILNIKVDTFGGTAGGPEKKPQHINRKPL